MGTRELVASRAESIAAVCEKYQIRELGVFGSVARGEDRASSDIDLFVEFAPGYHPGLKWFDLEEELEAIFGRPVDLSRKSLLRPSIRRQLPGEAIVLYAA